MPKLAAPKRNLEFARVTMLLASLRAALIEQERQITREIAKNAATLPFVIFLICYSLLTTAGIIYLLCH